MLRPCSIAVLYSALLLPGTALALGAGEITVKSTIGAALWAEIELTGSDPISPQELIAKLASRDQFQRLGVSRDVFLSQLKFELRTNDDGKQFLLVTSKDAVKEPFLNFVLDLQWAKGQLLREYAVLLDPPTIASNAVNAPQGPPPETQLAQPSIRENAVPSGLYTTRPGDSLWIIANRLRPSAEVSVQQTMQTLHQMNRSAFINGNINLLKARQQLRIPSIEDVIGVSEDEARQYVGTQINKGKQAIAARDSALQPTQPPSLPSISEIESEPLEEIARADIPSTQIEPSSSRDQLRLLNASEEHSLATQDIAQLQSTYSELMEEKAILLRTILQQYEELETLKDKQQALNQSLSQQRTLPASAIAANQDGSANTDERTATSEQTTAIIDPVAQKESGLSSIAVTQPIPGITSSDVMRHPAFVASLTTSLLLFLALVWLLLKRTGQPASERLTADKIISHELETNSPDEDITEEDKPAPAVPAADIRRIDLPEPDPLRIDDDQFIEEEDELDETIRAANIYLAYGRLREAKSLIRDALTQDPNREDLKLTLLELHCKEEDIEAFDLIASELDKSLSDTVQQQLKELRLLMNRPMESKEPIEAPVGTASTESLEEALLTDEELGLSSEELDYFPDQEVLSELDLDSASEDEWHQIKDTAGETSDASSDGAKEKP
ncbi:type IV pilus assembly protein FimV [Aestuariirhabdus sp. LZHN29]|uniref:type IV pilus assembly protein FimV n=1 Tax=Aestuariirhabdus sp. LZHN29 TaxID=3417462 RepID=UPI003CE6D65E